MGLLAWLPWDDASINHLLVMGYGASALLLVLYFAFESGPCHWSRRGEGLYIAVVLGLACAACILWSEARHEPSDLDGFLRARQLVRLVLACRIAQRCMLPGTHRSFYEGGSRASVRPKHSEQDQQHASQFNVLMDEISNLVSVKHSGRDRLFEPGLLAVLMLEDLLWAFKDLSRALNYPLLVALVLLPLPSLCELCQRQRRLWQLAEKVHRLLVDMVDNRAEGVLRCVLATVSVGTLVEVLRWETVSQLTERALQGNLLCTASKAILVDGLQRRGMRCHRRAQHSVCELVRSCTGEELTTFKNLIDGSGGYHNLYKLVYIDMGAACRRELLEHLTQEADKLRAERGRAAGVKVLSDIDDTLFSSGGLFPAGWDRRVPRHIVYPGFLSLLQVLDRNWSTEEPSCNIVFLSARPHVYKDLSEGRSYQQFRSLVQQGRMHSSPTLLPGLLWDSLRSVLTLPCRGSAAWRAVAQRKLLSYYRFRELYHEYDFCFCGDNGQGDLWAGQHMLEEQPSSGPRLLHVLIHRVLPDEAALAQEPPRSRGKAWRESWLRRGLILHDGYVEAALVLHKRDPDLLSAVQVADIAHAAISEFDAARWADKEGCARWSRAERDLQRSLRLLDPVLLAAGQAPLPCLRKTHVVQRRLYAFSQCSDGDAQPFDTVGPVGVCVEPVMEQGVCSNCLKEAGCMLRCPLLLGSRSAA